MDDLTPEQIRQEDAERKEDAVFDDEDGACYECGGSGEVPHKCFEDSCCCADPCDEICRACRGTGGRPRRQ